MRLSDLWQVNILETRLREKRSQLALLADGKGLGVTIQSTYQPEDVIDAVRPVVVAHLSETITEIETQLMVLGVDVSGADVG